MKPSNPAVPCKIAVVKFNLSSLNTNLVPTNFVYIKTYCRL